MPAQQFGMYWKRNTTGILSNGHGTGRPRKTTAVDNRNIVKAVKKNPKTLLSDITNNIHNAGLKVPILFEERRNTTRFRPLISSKNWKARLEFVRKYRDELQKFWNTILWTGETRLFLYQSEAKVWRKNCSAHDPKHTNSSVKHGRVNFLAWVCIATCGTGSLIFINDVTDDGSCRMNS